jgi:O-antigen/teichoic acid export membrane protein
MLAKYGSIQLLSRFLPGLIGFLVAALLTRLLPPAQYGTYGLAAALSQLFALAAFGWLGLSVTRIATGRSVDARFVTSVLALFAGLAAVAGLAGGLALLLPIEPVLAALAAAIAGGSIVLAYFDVTAAFLTAALDFRGFLVLNLARAITGAVLVCGAAYLIGDGLEVFAFSLVATLAVCLCRPGRARLAVSGGLDGPLIRRLIAFGMPIAGSLSLFALCGWSDRVVLGIGAGISAVGFYTAATVLVQNSLQTLAQAIGSAAYPLAVLAYDSGNRLASRRQLEQNFIALFGLLLPGAVGLSLLAPNVSSVLIGPSYRAAVADLTPLLAAAAVMAGIRSNFVDHAFQLTGSTTHYFWIAAGMAPVNLIALALLVPRFSYLGAGTALILTEATGLTHAVLAARRVYRMPFPRREAAKVLAAVLAMAAALLPVVDARGGLALAGQIVWGAVVYAAVLWALNLLNLRQMTASRLLRWLAARP